MMSKRIYTFIWFEF